MKRSLGFKRRISELVVSLFKNSCLGSSYHPYSTIFAIIAWVTVGLTAFYMFPLFGKKES